MRIVRNNFQPTYTEGQIYLAGVDIAIFTLELGWLPSLEHPGGTRRISCIPNGTYDLAPFTRPNGQEVVRLRNPAFGVYFDTAPEDKGRTHILIHPGNSTADIRGCILPGRSRSPAHVWESRLAMNWIMNAFHAGDTTLIIESFKTQEYPTE